MKEKWTWKLGGNKANSGIGRNKVKVLAIMLAVLITQLFVVFQVSAQVHALAAAASGGGGGGGTPPAKPGAVTCNVSNVTMPTATTPYQCPPLVIGTTTAWSISPSSAGTINGNLNNATVTWNQTFVGTATISVVAIDNISGLRSLPSFTTTLVINPVTVGAVSPATQTINNVASAATLISGAASAGSGGYTYQWQWSSTGDPTTPPSSSGTPSASLVKSKALASAATSANWADITGATGLTYNPIGLTSTTYYRMKVTSAGNPYYSNQVVVNVYPSITVPTISASSQTINPNTAVNLNIVNAASGGSGTFTQNWQSLVGGFDGVWQDIQGATGNTYNTGSLTGNAWYRLRVNSNGVDAYSNQVAITVTLTAPVMAINTTSLSYGGSASISFPTLPLGGDGPGSYKYTLQTSADGILWGNIGTPTTNTTISTGNLYASTNVRVLTTSRIISIPSNSVQVIVGLSTPVLQASATTVNYGGSANFTFSTLPQGGTQSYTYTLQSSPDNQTWSNIATSTGTSDDSPAKVIFNTGTLNNNTYFKVLVTSGSASTVSNSVQLIVNIVSPVISTRANINPGSQATLYVTTPAHGGTGIYSYSSWQSSPDGKTNWTPVSVTGDAINGFTPQMALSTNTFFMVSVSSGNASVNVGPIIAEVNLIAPTVVASPSLVNGGGQTTLSLSPLPQGETGGYTYTWQSSPDGQANNWTSITGFTNTSATTCPVTLPSNATYYRVITYSLDNSVNSSPTMVMVNLTAPTLSATTPIIFNTGGTVTLAAATAPQGGTGMYNYTLQSNTGNNTWTPIYTGTSFAPFTTGSITTTTNFQLIVTSGSGSNVVTNSSNIVTVSVINLNMIAIGPANSTIYPNGTVALYANKLPSVGTVSYQWQSHTDVNTSWTNINGATGTDYITPPLTTNTYYQLVASYNGSTGTSGTTTVTVNTVGIPPNPGTQVSGPIGNTITPGQYYSNTGIVLNPGFSADGANGSYTFVIASPNAPSAVTLPPSNPSDDADKNWVMIRSYDENGNEIAASKAFFDYNGKATQAQSRSETTGQVLASQSIDDVQGRPVVSTLAAPINNSGFAYNANFVTKTVPGSSTKPYSYLNFDGDPTSATPYSKLNNPDAVDNMQRGTLGWYYSNNNTAEPMVATTGLPYSRSEYYHDGTGAVKRSAGVGEALSMGSGHETTSNSFPVQNELNQYLAIRNQFFPAATVGASPTSMAGQALQSIATDQNGISGVSITDLSGKMSLMTGRVDALSPWLTVNNTLAATANRADFEVNINTSIGVNGTFVLNTQQVVTVYLNGAMVYSGIGSQYGQIYDYNQGIGGGGSYLVTSVYPFTYTYNYYQPNVGSVSNSVQVAFNESTASQQYFRLAAPSTVTITGGTYVLYDMTTETNITSAFKGNNTLAAGYYRVVATSPSACGPIASNTVTVNYTNQYADISYNYYNQLGQLIANIAPKGVQQIIQKGIGSYTSASQLPFVTTYQYDLQGRLISSTSTDGGTSNFVYRTDGKIRFSQNSFQASAGNNTSGNERFSYTNYDILGRPTESGEYSAPTGTFSGLATNTTFLDITDGTLPVATATKLNNINTYYDVPTTNLNLTNYVQDPGFLKGAVSYTTGSLNGTVTSSTWYNYDDHGRVAWTVKYINGLGNKTVDYTYNHQGNVTSVTYQKGANDEFNHYYAYDADGRLTNVQTSTFGGNKIQQVNYYYYLHGPLKRIELGNQLQGIDYVYTPQGWLKAINSPVGYNLANNTTFDPGQDGVNNGFAPDAFGMQLEYFPGDYVRSGSNVTNIVTGSSTNYYNGQVSGMSWQSNKPSSVISGSGTSINIQSPTMYTYTYDNKYQYTGATWGSPNNPGNNNSNNSTKNTFSPSNIFQENGINYDPNGNIQAMQHTGSTGTLVDNFTYNYKPNTNQLQSVTNAAGSNNTYGTYAYDEIGRLKSQTSSAGTTNVKYDVTGKIISIFDGSGTNLVSYGYDESGNRISRTDKTGTTYYVYDANGSVMAIYTQSSPSATPVETEVPFYGSGRLGTYFVAAKNYVYELRDNVGSVRVALNSTKLSNGQADVYKYDDYYPYGSVAQSGGQSYRYDYQGAYAEKDPVTGYNNFELRMYDGRIGRWLSTDPKHQFASPYEGMGNNPVNGSDPDGGECCWVVQNGMVPFYSEDLGFTDGQDLSNSSYGQGAIALNSALVSMSDGSERLLNADGTQSYSRYPMMDGSRPYNGFTISGFQAAIPAQGLKDFATAGEFTTTFFIGGGVGAIETGIISRFAEISEVAPEIEQTIEEEMVSVFHKGELNGGVVSSSRWLSTGTNRAAVEALEREGQVWEFRVPKFQLYKWENSGQELVSRYTDLDNATGAINNELRFSPKLAPQMNNYLIKP